MNPWDKYFFKSFVKWNSIYFQDLYIDKTKYLQLPMQSVSIATDVVSSNLDEGEMTNIIW
jgi:hypothetical protein